MPPPHLEGVPRAPAAHCSARVAYGDSAAEMDRTGLRSSVHVEVHSYLLSSCPHSLTLVCLRSPVIGGARDRRRTDMGTCVGGAPTGHGYLTGPKAEGKVLTNSVFFRLFFQSEQYFSLTINQSEQYFGLFFQRSERNHSLRMFEIVQLC